MGDSGETWSALRAHGGPAPRVLGGRWRLGVELGRGGFGRVVAADDLRGGAPAAVKLLPFVGTEQRRRLQREVTALRSLSVPGVVRIFDDGPVGAGHYIAMERLPPVPFPGPGPWAWARLRPLAIRLLTAVRDVHDAGVIHRDLKPGNILMRGGQPVILDFGLARGGDLGTTITRSGTPMGTVRYVSPEQGAGARVTARTDLYSIGVILFEALSGQLPHTARDAAELLRVKVTRPARSLASLCPGAAPEAVSLIDSLLAREPRERPADAREILARLEAGVEWRPSWLGPDAWLDELVERVRRGAHVRLGGEPGSGRTRVLQEVAARLPHLWLRPGQAPYASLAEALDGVELGSAHSAEEARSRVAEHLRGRFPLGSVLLVDAASIDWSSRRALADHPGGVLEVVQGPGDLVPPRPVELDLHRWFAGPERVLHLPSDGARELLRRAGPAPRGLLSEVRAWEREGLCVRGERGIEIDRTALDLLRAEAPARPRGVGVGGEPAPALSSELEEILELVDLGAPHATSPFLGAVLGREAWLLDAQVEELVDRRLLRRAATRLWLVGASRSGGTLSEARRTEAHRWLAARLEPGTAGRLRRLLDGGGPGDAILAEACLVARRLDEEGRFSRARAVLREAIGRVDATVPGQEAALALWVRLALESGEPAVLEPCLQQVGRRCRPSAPLARLLQARQCVRAGDGAGALEILDGIPVFEDADLEAVRIREVQLTATRQVHGGDGAVLQALLSTRADDPHALTWRAMLAYREGGMREAAALHEQAAAAWSGAGHRLRSMLTAATCWSWGGQSDRARELAAAGLAEAARRRLPGLELRAEWVLRNIAQKGGETQVDEELIRVARDLSADTVEASFVLLTESYVAWAGGERGRAGELAQAVHERFEARGIAAGASIAAALVAASRGDAQTLARLIDPRHPVAALDTVELLRGLSGDASAARELRDAVTAARPWLVGSHIGLFRVDPD